MFKCLACLSLVVVGTFAAPYGSSSSGNYGSSGGLSYGGGGLSSSGYDGGLNMGGHGGGGNNGDGQQVIEVSPDQLPVQVHFRTAASRLNVQQSHNPSQAPQVEHASFQDEPHRVVHEVVKPVIQEVREIIIPYRRVTQEIRPVIEEIHTVVHKGEGRGGAGGAGAGKYGGGGGNLQGGGKYGGGGPQYKSRA